MLNKLSGQKGFTPLHTLLLLVIVAIIGGTGYYIYSANKKTNDTLDAAAKSSQSSPNKASKKASKKAAQATQYLHIREWGVKVALTDDINDAYYVFMSGNNKDVYLSLRSLASTQCAADQTSVGAISRFTQNEIDDRTDATYLAGYPDAPRVGSYYYYFTPPQATCSDDSAIQAKADAARLELKAAVATTQAD